MHRKLKNEQEKYENPSILQVWQEDVSHRQPAIGGIPNRLKRHGSPKGSPSTRKQS